MKPSQETLREALSACLGNSNIQLSDVRDVLQTVRELFDIETVAVVSTVDYKYQADHLIICSREGAEASTSEHAHLTDEQYQQLVSGYLEQPVRDSLIFDVPGIVGKSILHTGVMRGNQLFGLVAFLCTKSRIWTDAEISAIESLRSLMLFYFGMTHLDDGGDKARLYEKKASDEGVISCYHLDLPTEQCHLVKVPSFLKSTLQEWVPYRELLGTYAQKYLDPVYGSMLLDRFSIERLRVSLSSKDGGTAQIELPRMLDGKTDWLRCSAEALAHDEQGNPLRAIILIKDITEDVQKRTFLKHDLNASRNSYAAIANVDLDTNRYAISVDNLAELIGSTPLDTFGNYSDALAFTSKAILNDKMAEAYKTMFSLESMREAFDSGETELSCEIPCATEDGHRWIRVEALPESDYRPGHKMVVHYFTDITKKKRRDLRLKEVSASLEEERKRAFEAEMKSTVDPLTGAFNRAGYEKFIASIKDSSESLGLLMLDVDYFKELNDNYGHAFGDEALTKTIGMLRDAFRDRDKIFRMGGDEFVILLPGCKTDAWPSIQKKLAAIHRGLKTTLSRNVPATLSAGLVVSEGGYTDDLAQLADEALYRTKLNGRAGLTQIDTAHNILHTWSDTEITSANRSKHNDFGTWRIEIPSTPEQRPRLFLNEEACMLLRVSPAISPEERYELWRDNVSPRHHSLLKSVYDKATATGKAECTYIWTHPSGESYSLHARAHYRNDGASEELSGYVTIVREDDVVFGHDDAQFLMQALQSINFCSYYIRLNDGEYFIVKGHEDEPDVDALHTNIDKTFAEFVSNLVHPDFQEAVSAFCDIATLAERLKGRTYLDCEYLSTTGYGWCRSRFLPVKWDSEGNLTHVLLSSASIEGAKREELERTKRHEDSMRLQLRVGEVISKTSIIQVGIMDKATGRTRIWMNGLFLENGMDVEFADAKAWGRASIVKEDAMLFENTFTLDNIVSRVERDRSYAEKFRIQLTGEEAERIILHHYETLQNDESKMLLVIEDITAIESKSNGWLTEFDVLETASEHVAIFDYETYDVVFMNKMSRDLIGMSPQELCTKKCYELMGETEPCSFCNDIVLTQGGNGFAVRQFAGTEEPLLVHGSVVERNGRRYRVEQAVPSSEIDESVELLQGVLITERRLISCIQKLYQLKDSDKALEYLLDQIVSFYDCGRACLNIEDGPEEGSLVLERCNAGVSPLFKPGDKAAMPAGLPFEEVKGPIEFRLALCDGKRNPLQSWMKDAGMTNLVVLEFEFAEGMRACISIDNVKKHADNTEWIGVLAFFIAFELEKRLDAKRGNA